MKRTHALMLSFFLMLPVAAQAQDRRVVSTTHWDAFRDGVNLYNNCQNGNIRGIALCNTFLSFRNRKNDWAVFGITVAYWRWLARLEPYVRSDRDVYIVMTHNALRLVQLFEEEFSVGADDICKNMKWDTLLGNPYEANSTQCSLYRKAYDHWIEIIRQTQ
jgi:hypothetical protein